MNRVRLVIVRGLHNPSLKAGHKVPATRIVARISFARDHGWTDFDDVAIVDTGAPLSLFPQSTWTSIRRHVLAPVMVGGIAEKPECKFVADLAVIECAVSDGVTTIGPFRMHALLAHNDKVPALLGLSGALDQVDLSVKLRSDSAYLETP